MCEETTMQDEWRNGEYWTKIANKLLQTSFMDYFIWHLLKYEQEDSGKDI